MDPAVDAVTFVRQHFACRPGVSITARTSSFPVLINATAVAAAIDPEAGSRRHLAAVARVTVATRTNPSTARAVGSAAFDVGAQVRRDLAVSAGESVNADTEPRLGVAAAVLSTIHVRTKILLRSPAWWSDLAASPGEVVRATASATVFFAAAAVGTTVHAVAHRGQHFAVCAGVTFSTNANPIFSTNAMGPTVDAEAFRRLQLAPIAVITIGAGACASVDPAGPMRAAVYGAALIRRRRITEDATVCVVTVAAAVTACSVGPAVEPGIVAPADVRDHSGCHRNAWKHVTGASLADSEGIEASAKPCQSNWSCLANFGDGALARDRKRRRIALISASANQRWILRVRIWVYAVARVVGGPDET